MFGSLLLNFIHYSLSLFLFTIISLSDLENSRDDLLFELHKLPNQNPSDITVKIKYILTKFSASNIVILLVNYS